MNKWIGGVLIVFIIGILIGVVIIPAIAQEGGKATIPKRVSYQGYLEDKNTGDPITDPVNMYFALHTETSGGTEVWSEYHAGVTPVDGLFSVDFGSQGNQLRASNLDGDRYLGITVGGDAEMTPRQRLSSVGYALRAEIANSACALDSPDGNLDDVVYVDNDGDVGIGTTVPSAPFDIGREYASTNVVEDMLEIDRGTSGTATSGIGSGVIFRNQVSNGAHALSGRISSLLEDAASGSSRGAMLFQTRALSGSMSDALYLDPDGNAGIGTNNPSTKLEVAGTVTATAFVGDGSQLINLPGDNLGNHTANQNIRLGSYYLSGDGDSEGIYIDSDGKTGIGTTNPSTELDVVGTVTANAFFGNGSELSGLLQLTRDFVVSSGTGVNAGDVVTFLNSEVKKYSNSGSPTWGSEAVFHSYNLGSISLAQLTDSKFVITYAGAFGGMAIIGEVSDMTITYGIDYWFNLGEDTAETSVVALSDSKFVVVYGDWANSQYGTAAVGDVSGTEITFGSEYVFNSGSTMSISAANISNPRSIIYKIVVAYQDDSNSDYGTAIVGEISGTTIIFGSEYVFNAANTDYISTASLSDTKFVVTYRDIGNSNYGTAIVGEVSDKTIAYGCEYLFSEVVTSDISIDSFSDTGFILAYMDESNAYNGTVLVGEIFSDTAITFGPSYVFNSDGASSICISVLPSQKFVVINKDWGNSYYGTAVIGDISGTQVSFGPRYLFTTAFAFPAMTPLGDSKFVIAYRDEDSSLCGSAIVGELESTGEIVGIARESKSAGQTVPVIINGISNVHTGLTPGKIYYSSDSGDLTTDISENRIGFAVSATELILDIDWAQ